MPTYDYECDSCGHSMELFQNISESPLRKCPACKRLKLRRLFGTGVAIVFKGSGFYQTDYRTESYKKGAEADRKATESSSGDADSADSKSSSESKSSDSKPKEPKESKVSEPKPKSSKRKPNSD